MGRQRTAERALRGGTRHWTVAEAKEVLGEWKASGIPLGTFARQKGLNDTRLRWWKTRLGDWGDGRSVARGPAFIPAVVREVIGAGNSCAPVTVRLPGGVLVVVADPASVPSSWLTAVVSGLERAG